MNFTPGLRSEKRENGQFECPIANRVGRWRNGPDVLGEDHQPHEYDSWHFAIDSASGKITEGWWPASLTFEEAQEKLRLEIIRVCEETIKVAKEVESVAVQA